MGSFNPAQEGSSPTCAKRAGAGAAGDSYNTFVVGILLPQAQVESLERGRDGPPAMNVEGRDACPTDSTVK